MKQVSYLLSLLLLVLLAACRGDKPAEAVPDAPADSLLAPADSAADSTEVSEPEPPAAADGVFDDFVFNFMRNKRFQRQRVRFPLTVREGGEERQLSEAEWKFDRLFSREEVYTMLFDTEKSMRSSKDTAVKRVCVEQIDLRRKNVRQYVFEKLRGMWQLTLIDIHALAQDANSDFYGFYARFAADEGFQVRHVANPFSLVVYDPDTFERMEGSADAAQWTDYAPELPTGTVTNVNYGQQYGATGRRVLVVSSVNGAMSSTLSFRKAGKGWMATKLENN